jgi:hypothetical protein
MALTKVKCPECREATQTAKVVSAGAKVRCPRRKTVFPFRPSANDGLDDLPIFEPEEPRPVRERLAPDNRMTSDSASDEVSGRYRGITNEKFDPDQRITIDRMALKSERLKDRLREGKPPRFDGPRQFIAVVVIFALMGLGYGLFWWFHGWYYDLSNAQRMRQEYLARQTQNPQKPRTDKPTKPKASTAELPTPRTSTSARATAPAPVRIGDLEIEITTARITRVRMNKGAGNRDFYLTLSVRVHNRSGQPLEYKGWHFARNLPTLKDAKTKTSYGSVKYFPIDLPQDCIPQTVIPTGGSILDLLVFDPPAFPYPSLELDLPSPIWYNTYKFYIPMDLIERVEEEPAPLADAPLLPVPEKCLQPKRQPTREEQILAEYLEKWSEIVQIASNKGSRAADYKSRRKQELVDELCKNYKLTRQDLKAIIPK